MEYKINLQQPSEFMNKANSKATEILKILISSRLEKKVVFTQHVSAKVTSSNKKLSLNPSCNEPQHGSDIILMQMSGASLPLWVSSSIHTVRTYIQRAVKIHQTVSPPSLIYIQSAAVWANQEQAHPWSLNSADWNVRRARFRTINLRLNVSLQAQRRGRSFGLPFNTFQLFSNRPNFHHRTDISVVVSESRWSEVNTVQSAGCHHVWSYSDPQTDAGYDDCSFLINKKENWVPHWPAVHTCKLLHHF